MSDSVDVKEEWILGPENTPFFTMTWSPVNTTPTAHVLFVHGFAEHIARYDHYFRKLATAPYNLHILAFDQRGHGRTSMTPLDASHPEVKEWKEAGKTVKLEKNGKRRTGGWAKAMPDIEWFVKYLSQKAGGKIFLYGFSMGGGQVIGFATRPHAPPSQQTLGLLAGVIAGGPLIKLTTPPHWLQVKSGSIAANLGLGSFLIPTELKYEHLSHNKESNERNKNDPLCEQLGSLRGVADMIQHGAMLVSSAPLEKFPKDLPLLVYHGEDDPICSVDASREFVNGAQAEDKKHHAFKGMLHEVHNEHEPTPTECANLVGEWIVSRASHAPTSTSTTTAPAPAASGQSKL